MKRILYLLIPALALIVILGFMLTQSSGIVATRHTHPKPPSYPFEEAEKIAQANLPRFTASVGYDYVGFGFKSEDELKRATLGKPYLSYGFDARLMADKQYRRADFRDSLDGGTTIEFPVLVDNEPRSNITVDYRDGVWQGGDGAAIGRMGLWLPNAGSQARALMYGLICYHSQ